MEWLRNRPFLNKQPKALLSTGEECDPQACYDSFKEHCQQTLKIILRTQELPSHDDVLGVVNHLEQMVTLLIYDMKRVEPTRVPLSVSSKCLDFMLQEDILDKLFSWGIKAGKYTNAVKCEQLKIYESLISQSRHVLVVHEAFLKPMLKLLNSCNGELFSKEMEKFLVDLLNQLCALLMQNSDLIELFVQKDQRSSKFIIFSLLIPYIHREDTVGMRARDAILLCMSLSKKNDNVVTCIAEYSNFSVLVASGLSALYSVLPNALDDICVPDWHRLTPDDVNDIKGLSTFVTSLEFSNAVAQVAHPTIRKQLQEYMYRGFLIPVLGPALLQNNVEEQVGAMVYLELVLRTVSQPGLLYSVLQFLLKMDYDGSTLLNILIQRLSSDNQLCLVGLSLFETMVDLNCEDLMLELVFQYLVPMNEKTFLDPYCHSFEKILMLSPGCCDGSEPAQDGMSNMYWNFYEGQQSLCGKYSAYLCDARYKIAACRIACSSWNNSYADASFSEGDTKCEESPTSSESIGYESLQSKAEEDFPWQVSRHRSKMTLNTVRNVQSEGAGLFLTTLLEKLNQFLSNSFYINLHITGLISRLAVYPQLNLRASLLDYNAPNGLNLFQVIEHQKIKIDEYMKRQSDCYDLLKYAKSFLIERETRLINARRHAIDPPLPPTSPVKEAEPFQRNTPKRRSLNLISSVFGRRASQVDDVPLASAQHQQQKLSQISESYPRFNEGQHVAICAVLLDEWVKELAALAQEHTIAQLACFLNYVEK